MSIISLIHYTLFVLYTSSATFIIASPTPDRAPVLPRQTSITSDVSIAIYNDTTCGIGGPPKVIENYVQLWYAVMVSFGFSIQSYRLNRTLRADERLDWSNPYAPGTAPKGGVIPENCGTFLQTTNPDSNDHMLREGVCYQMTGGAQLCGLPWIKNRNPGRLIFSI